jgi:hypothetical protein
MGKKHSKPIPETKKPDVKKPEMEQLSVSGSNPVGTTAAKQLSALGNGAQSGTMGDGSLRNAKLGMVSTEMPPAEELDRLFDEFMVS